MENRPAFNVLFLGNAGVGKSSHVLWNLTGEFKEKYIPTTAPTLCPLTWTTNHGTIQFDLWDIPGGSNSTPESRAESLKKADAAIIMFDLTRRATFDSVINWYRELVSAKDSRIPVVVCGNMADKPEEDHKVNSSNIKWPVEMLEVKYYDLSAVAAVNLENPYLWIMQQFFGDPFLKFEGVICQLPSQKYTEEEIQRYEMEMDAAMKMPVPSPEEEDHDI